MEPSPEDARPASQAAYGLFWLGVIGAGVWVLFFTLRNGPFFHDDAYITLRYARHVIEGKGPVWNPGERVWGFTSPLHLGIVSTLGLTGLDLVAAARLTGWLAWTGLVVLLALGARQWAALAFTPFLRWLPALLAATAAPLLLWATGGLEGVLFATWVAAGTLVLLPGSDRRNRFPVRQGSLAGLLLALAALTRPEGLVFLAGAGLWTVIGTVRGGCSWRLPVALATVAAAVGVPVWLGLWTFFGEALPNTFHAKTGLPLNLRLSAGLEYLLSGLLLPPWLVPAYLLTLAGRLRGPGCGLFPGEGLILVQVGAGAAAVAWSGGDHMPGTRFLLPLLPLAALGLAAGLARFGWGLRGRLVLAGGLALAVASQALVPSFNPGGLDPAARVGGFIGRYIDRAWPKDALIAVNTAGSLPYHAPDHRFIDMLGLTDATIARRELTGIRLTWQLVPGHLKGDGAYILERAPEFIILGPAHGTTADAPWFLSDLELAESQAFGTNYRKETIAFTPDQNAAEAALNFTYYRRVE